MAWTLETDLLDAAGSTVLRDALCRLGLIDHSCVAYSLRDEWKWERGGSETYLYPFDVIADGEQTRCLLKACVTVGKMDGVDRYLDEWLFRRQTIARRGVSVPYLYGRVRGSTIEEFVPYTFKEAITVGVGNRQATLAAALGRTAGHLAKCGFVTLDLRRLRSRGFDAVVVDFGEDLGPPGVTTSDNASALDAALELLDDCGTDPSHLKELIEAYESV